MPPTPTPSPTGAGGEITRKGEAALVFFATATVLVCSLCLCWYVAPLTKGNYVLRELARFLSCFILLLIPFNLFNFVVFVYHLQGESIRRTIGFFCLWGAISFGLWNLI